MPGVTETRHTADTDQTNSRGSLTELLGVTVVGGFDRPTHTVRDWIRLEYELYRGGRDPQMQPYDGPRDFVVRLGQDFPYRPLPKGVRRRAPRQCFHNAALLALRRPNEFLYAEGYAVNIGICTEHAWCVDRNGFAVDTTWRGPDSPQYFGVPFQHGYVMERAEERGTLGSLINVWYGQDQWPLCTGAHPLENALADLDAWVNPMAEKGGL
jgi:hypothetical protein